MLPLVWVVASKLCNRIHDEGLHDLPVMTPFTICATVLLPSQGPCLGVCTGVGFQEQIVCFACPKRLGKRVLKMRVGQLSLC